MFTLKIKNDKGDTYELTHNYKQYYVTSIVGLTPPAVNINTSTAGLLDGTFYNSSRSEQRNIVITLVLLGDIEGSRQQLYSVFPLKKEIEIYYTNKNRKLKIKGYVESIEGDLFVQQEEMQISIICPRPYFEGVSAVESEISRVVPLFEFPFSISEPIPISELRSIPICSIDNPGDIECGCVITATAGSDIGTIGGLKVTNLTTKEYFYVNVGLFSSWEVEFGTLPGELYGVLRGSGVEINLLPYIIDGSTWFKLAPGRNVLTYSLDTGDVDDITVIVNFTPLYGGA